MRRSSRHVVVLPSKRHGLAVPTLTAAVVCGGSVLVIAVTGTVALEGGDGTAAEMLSPASPVGGDPAVTLPAVARSPRVSMISPDVTRRRSERPAASPAARSTLTQARTAREYVGEYSPIAAASVASSALVPAVSAIPGQDGPGRPFRVLVRDGGSVTEITPAGSGL